MVIACFGAILGVAEIASADNNAKGCRTVLKQLTPPPPTGPQWQMVCYNPTCPSPCTPKSMTGDLHIFNCPDNPGSYPAEFIFVGAKCITFIESSSPYTTATLYCYTGSCQVACIDDDHVVEGGTTHECSCPP